MRSIILPTFASLALALVLGAADGARAGDYTAGALKIGHPWTRATPKGAKVAAGYLSITNTGSSPERLTGGSFAEAKRVEVHQMSMEGGVMKMAPVEGGLEIPPGATVTLSPSGYHMMFMDLKDQLKTGGAVKGTLVFERAGTVPVEFTVESLAAGAPAADRAKRTHDH
jgi:periplasmic copper chaperone A